MATNFPNSVDSLTNPTTSDTLASVSHSQQHSDANDAIEAIELALLDGAPLHIDDANERVGIGKTNPSVLLDLEHATQANIHVNDSGGTIGGDANARLSFLAGGGLAGQVGFLDTTDGTMTVQNSVGDIAVEIASAGNVTFDLYDGNVGIGTNNPTVKLHVDSGSTAQFAAPQIYVAPSGHASSDRAAIQLDDIQLLTDIAGNGAEDFSIYSNTAGAHRLSIDSSGNVGIGTYSPSAKLDVNGETQASYVTLDRGGIAFAQPAIDVEANGVGAGDYNYFFRAWNDTGVKAVMFVNGSTRTADGGTNTMTIRNDGGGSRFGNGSYLTTITGNNVHLSGMVGIGTDSPAAQLTVKASSTGLDDGTVEFHSWSGSASSPTEVEDWPTPVLALRAYDNFYVQTMLSFGYPQDAIYQTGNHAWMFRLESGYGATQSSTSTNLRLLGQGTFLVGNFNASGTKTFRIQHPLPELNETHDLLHNSVESPQADNLYRGHATLVDGVATVNLDEAAGMTEGTFVLLNRDIQCFTSNENGWTAVRGSVTGNVLTIVAQDSSCVDTVSWLVVGERQDDEIKASKDTDDEGHLIVEPLTNRVSEADIAESEARMEAARQAAQQEETE